MAHKTCVRCQKKKPHFEFGVYCPMYKNEKNKKLQYFAQCEECIEEMRELKPSLASTNNAETKKAQRIFRAAVCEFYVTNMDITHTIVGFRLNLSGTTVNHYLNMYYGIFEKPILMDIQPEQ